MMRLTFKIQAYNIINMIACIHDKQQASKHVAYLGSGIQAHDIINMTAAMHDRQQSK
jgi:hypothetical protein